MKKSIFSILFIFVMFVFCVSQVFAGQKYIQSVVSDHNRTTNATLTNATITNATVTNLSAVSLTPSGTSTLADVVIGDEFSFTANTAYSALQISSEISPTDSFYVIVSTGDNVSTATPQISTTSAVSGQIITILNSGTSSYTFGDNDSVSGSLLELGSTARAIDQGDILKLIYYSGKWYEIGFYNN